jgi:hypothetical protein
LTTSQTNLAFVCRRQFDLITDQVRIDGVIDEVGDQLEIRVE